MSSDIKFNISWPDDPNDRYITLQGIQDSHITYSYPKKTFPCLSHTVKIDAWRTGEHSGRCKTCNEVVSFEWSHADVFDIMQKLQKIENPSQEQIKLLMSAYQVLRHNIDAERRVLDVYDSALKLTEAGLKVLLSKSEDL